MDSWGQNKHLTKRRRRGWLITFAVVVVAIIGWGVYAKLSQPQVKVLWEYHIDTSLPSANIQPLDQGGVAFGFRDMMQFDCNGDSVAVYSPPWNVCKTKLDYGQVNSVGEFCCRSDDRIIAFDVSGNKRWEAWLPDIGVISNKPMNRMVYITDNEDGSILATYNSGEFAKLDHDGNVLFHSTSPTSPAFFSAPIQLTDELFAATAITGQKQQISNVVIFNRDAETLWSSNFPGFAVDKIARFQDLLIVDMLNDHVYAVDFTGVLQWEYKNPDPIPNGAFSHSHIAEIVDDQFVLVVSEQYIVALDNDGNQLWAIKGNYFTAPVTVSANIQYIIELEWSKFQANARRNTAIQLGQYIPSVWQQLPQVPTYTTILRLDNGLITKRWRAPDSIVAFVGPGADGEFYLFSSTQNDGTLYCVKLD